MPLLITSRVQFLGYEIECYPNPEKIRAFIPRLKEELFLRNLVKSIRGFPRRKPFELLLAEVNLVLRGWGNYYADCQDAKVVFSRVDQAVFQEIFQWLMGANPATSREALYWGFIIVDPINQEPRWTVEGVDCVTLDALRREHAEKVPRMPDWLPLQIQPGLPFRQAA